MSFDGIKNQLVARLGALGFIESKEAFDFESASPNEYSNTFILIPVSGTMETGETETLVGRFYDVQEWQIHIAFAKSAHNKVSGRDSMSRKIVDIIKDLDNTSNWEGVTNGARNQRYESWEIEDVQDYFLLKVILQITDTIIY